MKCPPKNGEKGKQQWGHYEKRNALPAPG